MNDQIDEVLIEFDPHGSLAVSNALSSANMALAGFDQVIPLDEVITVMDAVGRRIFSELRCTAQGGLSVSQTSKAIEKRLKASG